MPFEQTTDKIKEQIPEIETENLKNSVFNFFDAIKPMFGFIFSFLGDLFKEMFNVFSKVLRRKFD